MTSNQQLRPVLPWSTRLDRSWAFGAYDGGMWVDLDARGRAWVPHSTPLRGDRDPASRPPEGTFAW